MLGVLLIDTYSVQATYFMPSSNSLSPRGKLYSKVCNLILKKRQLGGQVKQSPVNSTEEPVAWEALEEGCNNIIRVINVIWTYFICMQLNLRCFPSNIILQHKTFIQFVLFFTCKPDIKGTGFNAYLTAFSWWNPLLQELTKFYVPSESRLYCVLHYGSSCKWLHLYTQICQDSRSGSPGQTVLMFSEAFW